MRSLLLIPEGDKLESRALGKKKADTEQHSRTALYMLDQEQPTKRVKLM